MTDRLPRAGRHPLRLAVIAAGAGGTAHWFARQAWRHGRARPDVIDATAHPLPPAPSVNMAADGRRTRGDRLRRWAAAAHRQRPTQGVEHLIDAGRLPLDRAAHHRLVPLTGVLQLLHTQRRPTWI